MEKVNEFLKRNIKYIQIGLVNIIAVLLLSLFLSFLNIVDINIFIRFRHLLFLTLFIILILILFLYEESKKKNIYKNISKVFFFTTLLLGILSTYNINISFTLLNPYTFVANNFAPYINFLFIASSFLLLWMHKEEIKRVKKLKLSNKVAYLILFLILIGFTVLKAPYFNHNFTGYHSMKYNTYVEPAKYMAERGDFTWYQQKYLANPISNPQGGPKKLPQLPLLEWSLASVFTIFKNNSIELNTRLVTHAIGLITLLFTFLLVRKWSNNIYSLIATGLMATNSIVAFATFVTVYDGINFMFLLISLFLLTKYLEKKKSLLPLFLSGIFIGLGISIKVSFLIWAFPVTILFVFFREKDFSKKILNLGILYIFAIIVYLTTKFSIPTLGEEPTKSLLLFTLGICVLIMSYILIKKFGKYILNTILNLNKRKILIPLIVILVLISIPLGFHFLVDDNLLENFLTDERFLFNIPFYKYMIVTQFIPFVTLPLFLVSMVGFVSLGFQKNKNIRQINMALFVTAIFFWIVASKSIFPHSYYTEIIMLSLILGSTTSIYCLFKISNSIFFRSILIPLIAAFVLPISIQNVKINLGPQIYNFEDAAIYLEENTEEEDIYIDESYLLSLTLRTGRARVGDVNMFSDEGFKKDVRELGFGSAMEKYNVKYLITYGNTPNYEKYVHIFTDEYLESTEFNRGQILLHIMNPVKYTWYSDSEKRGKLIIEYDLENKFEFEKQVGPYRFFRFKD